MENPTSQWGGEDGYIPLNSGADTRDFGQSGQSATPQEQKAPNHEEIKPNLNLEPVHSNGTSKGDPSDAAKIAELQQNLVALTRQLEELKKKEQSPQLTISQPPPPPPKVAPPIPPQSTNPAPPPPKLAPPPQSPASSSPAQSQTTSSPTLSAHAPTQTLSSQQTPSLRSEHSNTDTNSTSAPLWDYTTGDDPQLDQRLVDLGVLLLSKNPPIEFGIFVSDIARGVTDDQLLAEFKKFGNVYEATVVKDKRSGETKGYGFVRYYNMDDVNAALNFPTLPVFEDAVSHKRQPIKIAYADAKNTLFITNLPVLPTEQIMKEIVEIGKVVPIKYELHINQRSPKGFGYIAYQDHDASVRAMKNLLQAGVIHGSSVMVSIAESSQIQKAGNASRSLFVKGTQLIDEGTIAAAFGTEVERIVNPLDQVSKHRLPHTFVHYKTREAAEKYMNLLNGTSLGGHPITIEWCVPQHKNLMDKRPREDFNNFRPNKRGGGPRGSPGGPPPPHQNYPPPPFPHFSPPPNARGPPQPMYHQPQQPYAGYGQYPNQPPAAAAAASANQQYGYYYQQPAASSTAALQYPAAQAYQAQYPGYTAQQYAQYQAYAHNYPQGQYGLEATYGADAASYAQVPQVPQAAAPGKSHQG
eukprot:TRINITY_DN6469_c0_g1_i1.p1 TRINITY_DN6469_c0_g1~~TRINITY_DN6469_c0_g1_i1.p1  ORF type:complete len:638 (+),score=100.79 TRINITY_DN6469_c0_g1_i1:137-2050(+)